MPKVGDNITYVIPIRSSVNNRTEWLELYDNIRSGREDIVAAMATDIDTIKVVTKVVKRVK